PSSSPQASPSWARPTPPPTPRTPPPSTCSDSSWAPWPCPAPAPSPPPCCAAGSPPPCSPWQPPPPPSPCTSCAHRPHSSPRAAVALASAAASRALFSVGSSARRLGALRAALGWSGHARPAPRAPRRPADGPSWWTVGETTHETTGTPEDPGTHPEAETGALAVPAEVKTRLTQVTTSALIDTRALAGVRARFDDEQAHALARYLSAAQSPNTLRAYRSDWTAFSAWCAAENRTSLPADPVDVAVYLAAAADTVRDDDPDRWALSPS